MVKARQVRVTQGEPIASQTYTGTTLPLMHTDNEFVLDQAADLLEVSLDWPTPDDMDLYVFFRNADGTLTQVGSSTSFILSKERVLVENPQAGTYVLRVENFASATPTWTMTASLWDTAEETIPGLIEAWTLSCEKDGTVLEQVAVVVDRGQQAKVDLKQCAKEWKNS